MAKTRSVFSQAELDYLHGQRLLGRIATVGADGTPHVAPVGWAHNTEKDTIDVTGHGLEQTEALRTPEALIRIHPERIVSWGHGPGRSARTARRAASP